MKPPLYLAALLAALAALLLADALNASGMAPLWAALGLTPALGRGYLWALIFLLGVVAVLRGGRGGNRVSIGADIETALDELVRPAGQGTARDGRHAGVALVVFAVIFAVLLSKYDGGFVLKWPIDQLWHQAFVDYDAQWQSPLTSLPGNLLYQFDIRSPVNARLMPVLGLSTLFPSAFRVTASYSLLFAGMTLLFRVVGTTFGLRPLPRAIFAGMVALMTVLPTGITAILWFFPPNFFTTQSLLATWWGEAPMLALATVVAFCWIGRHAGAVRNALTALIFALGSYLAVVAYPAGAVYFIPVIVIYCAVFFVTSERRSEWLWKGATGAVVAAIMLALNVPAYFINLYGYTFGSAFAEDLRAPATALVGDTFMIAARGLDWRGVLVFFAGIAMAVAMAMRGPPAIRRFAVAVLACEIAIVFASLANALTVRAPMLLAYAEVAHAAMWGSFAVLAAMAVAVVMDRRIAMTRLAPRRHAAYGVGLAGAVLAFWIASPKPEILVYPPRKPPAVQLLADELALAPGKPFRGRVATIYARQGDTPFPAIAMRYQRLFGADFYSDLLPHGIPMLNQAQVWTSPVMFAVTYRFFATAGSAFEKNFFWLDRFDGKAAAKVARMRGVRFVVSDTALANGTLVSAQTAGGHTLRVYRLDGVNVGQYSPTHAVLADSAASAVAAIAADAFDPARDVVTEEPLPSGLVPASSVTVTTETGPRLQIRARSEGQSLIVLPFEFSHCLRVSGSGARLLPVNLQQAGLLFDKTADVSITYRFGVTDSACRGADIARAERLRLREIVTPR